MYCRVVSVIRAPSFSGALGSRRRLGQRHTRARGCELPGCYLLWSGAEPGAPSGREPPVQSGVSVDVDARFLPADSSRRWPRGWRTASDYAFTRSPDVADLSIASMTSWRRTASSKSGTVCVPSTMFAANGHDTASGMVRQKALLVAYGVHETGRREVIGLQVGEVESEAEWRSFLRGLVARGLCGVRLAISDAHQGLRNAIGQVLGAQWQRCSVHFVRDMLGHVPKQAQPMVRGALKQIFAAPDRESAGETLAAVVDQLQAPAGKVARLLEQVEEELLAYMRFPREHWPKIRSTNPLERVNLEIARRSDVVGIYPNDAALLRLATSLLVEQNDEWLVQKRYLSLGSIAQLTEPSGLADDDQPALPQGALAAVGKSTT
jgi:putative transposase